MNAIKQIPQPVWHDENPWRDSVVYVPIEELATCLMYLGEPCGLLHADGTESSYIMTPESQLAQWRLSGNGLDAYILPQPDGRHSIGIRYGGKAHQYISPYGHKQKVQALLDKYQPKRSR